MWFISFVQIYLSEAWTITCVTMFLDHSVFILFMGFVLVSFYWLYFICSIMGRRACSIFPTPRM